MSEISYPSGLRISTFEPGADFDPLTADIADLVGSGFPARPDDPRHLDRFEDVFRRLKGKFDYIVPTFRLNADRFHAPRRSSASVGAETSTNWSGAVVYAPTGQSFKWIEGDWVVPNVEAPSPNGWYYAATWIGIDGDQSDDVCQAGVAGNAYTTGSSTIRQIYPWWEWYPEAEIEITNLAVNPGDMVTCLICTSGGAGSTTATVYFSNRTTGASTSFRVTAPTGTALVGNCAEWVVEAPTVGGAQSSLADYGEVFFSVAEAVTETATTVDGGSGDNINMTDISGAAVSDGRLVTSTVIQCEYVGTGPESGHGSASWAPPLTGSRSK